MPTAERAQIHGSETLTACARDRRHLDPGARARERAGIESEGELSLAGHVWEMTLYERRRACDEPRAQAAPARHRRCGGCRHGSDTAGPGSQTLLEAVGGDTLEP